MHFVEGVAADEGGCRARREHLVGLDVIRRSALAVANAPWQATDMIRVACAVEP